ncbi:response regulator transcription factor [Salipiger profundus]|uniref:response regulator transcription factor n=1 Tax=Salipiger profundus TaxID=1229727 RepID=UPI0008E5BD7E|nr:response regulator transcription factor [Salipiger profundus]SFD94605.1 two-component system, OmpR family, response regulator [Salipiger profundus]
MHIAIIEDNEALAVSIAQRLQSVGHTVDVLDDGLHAVAFLRETQPEIVILDLNLPNVDGLEILKHLRSAKFRSSIIILTARDTESDRVAGLDLGADDYLVKPFSMRELEARVRALSRRNVAPYLEFIQVASLVFERNTRTVKIDGVEISLPRRELAVLECLLERRGRIVARVTLLDKVYGVGSDVELSAIEPHVSRLRRKLQGSGLEIKVSRGLGYTLGERE